MKYLVFPILFFISLSCITELDQKLKQSENNKSKIVAEFEESLLPKQNSTNIDLTPTFVFNCVGAIN